MRTVVSVPALGTAVGFAGSYRWTRQAAPRHLNHRPGRQRGRELRRPVGDHSDRLVLHADGGRCGLRALLVRGASVERCMHQVAWGFNPPA